MLGWVIAAAVVLLVVAVACALYYRNRRNKAVTRATAAEGALAIVDKDRAALAAEYAEFRRRAQADQLELQERHQAELEIRAEEPAVYREVIHARLTAPLAAELSDRVSRLLQERQARRRAAGGGPGTGAPPVPGRPAA